MQPDKLPRYVTIAGRRYDVLDEQDAKDLTAVYAARKARAEARKVPMNAAAYPRSSLTATQREQRNAERKRQRAARKRQRQKK